MSVLKPDSTLLCIGDSITDCGRARPLGSTRTGLGTGYVSIIDALIQANHPAMRIRVLNVGVSGNTCRDLDARWNEDVIAHRPDFVTIMIGTNDVWRQFDSPYETTAAVMPEEYEQTLGRLVTRASAPVLLATPFYIESSLTDAMRTRMDEYGRIVQKLAQSTGSLFLDTQALFSPFLAEYHSAAIAWDRVHPTLTGHVLLGQGFYRALGF
jgi:lysophospholipase L1-like esterase